MGAPMKEKNNIIQFPLERRWAKIDLMRRFASRERRELEKKQVALSISLVSVLVIVAVANSNFLNSKKPSLDSSRSIASVDSQTSLHSRNIEWEGRLIDQLEKMNFRGTASLSQKPSQKDKLQFGVLEGKYFLGYNSGKLNEIRFSPSQQGSDPKYINNRLQFIKDYKDLLALQFDEIEKKAMKIKVDEKSEPYEEHYKLLNENASVAEVAFRLDKYGRFLGMKVNTH